MRSWAERVGMQPGGSPHAYRTRLHAQRADDAVDIASSAPPARGYTPPLVLALALLLALAVGLPPRGSAQPEPTRARDAAAIDASIAPEMIELTADVGASPNADAEPPALRRSADAAAHCEPCRAEDAEERVHGSAEATWAGAITGALWGERTFYYRVEPDDGEAAYVPAARSSVGSAAGAHARRTVAATNARRARRLTAHLFRARMRVHYLASRMRETRARGCGERRCSLARGACSLALAGCGALLVAYGRKPRPADHRDSARSPPAYEPYVPPAAARALALGSPRGAGASGGEPAADGAPAAEPPSTPTPRSLAVARARACYESIAASAASPHIHFSPPAHSPASYASRAADDLSPAGASARRRRGVLIADRSSQYEPQGEGGPTAHVQTEPTCVQHVGVQANQGGGSAARRAAPNGIGIGVQTECACEQPQHRPPLAEAELEARGVAAHSARAAARRAAIVRVLADAAMPIITIGGGASADGAPADGAPADGAPSDGAPADGAPADGAPGGTQRPPSRRRAEACALSCAAALVLWPLALALASSALAAPVLAQARSTVRATKASVREEVRILQLERQELSQMLSPLALADAAREESAWSAADALARRAAPRDVQSTVAFQHLGALALVSQPDARGWGGMWMSVAARTLVQRTGSTIRAFAHGARGAFAASSAAASTTSSGVRFVAEHTVARAARAVRAGSGRLRAIIHRSRELQQRRRVERRWREATWVSTVAATPPRATPSAAPAAPADGGRSMAGGVASRLYGGRR
ncbi:hypothetical protein KFE25_006675 [Diacronema lutheri]|uniref:Uncharacterized protein n=1 Tax=Diacronema lutheri TaxID=2081491 RepID=A0A8J5XMD3_DIALT|nr:hypothetical protein KFE25_006675 [Diacronema lutheri]